MKDIRYLENESISKLLIKFSGPAIIGMLVIASYNIVDRLFVGRGVGPLAISGIVVSFPLMIAVMAFGLLIGIGASALVSIRLGEKRKEDAEKIVGQAFILALIISTVITIAGFLFLDSMLFVFGGTGEVYSYAREYMEIMLFGVIFQIITLTMNNIIRGEGNPKAAMLTMIISGVINVILNPIFIFYLHLGIRGAALATLISEIISCVWTLYYFFGKRSLLKIRIKNFILEKKIVLSIFSIGMSPFIMQIVGSFVAIIFNNSLLLYGGDLAIAAMGIAQSLVMFLLMPVMGISQGMQPIIGYNFGAKRYDRVKGVLRISLITSITVCTMGFLLIFIFAENIITVFGKNDIQLNNIFCHGTRILVLMLPVIGIQIIGSGYFQAVNKAIKSVMLTLSRQVILLIPLLLILPRMFKLEGIWMSGPIADAGGAILTILFLIKEFKILSNMAVETII